MPKQPEEPETVVGRAIRLEPIKIKSNVQAMTMVTLDTGLVIYIGYEVEEVFAVVFDDTGEQAINPHNGEPLFEMNARVVMNCKKPDAPQN